MSKMAKKNTKKQPSPSKKVSKVATAPLKAKKGSTKKASVPKNQSKAVEDVIELPAIRSSDEPLVQTQNCRWINKQRLMVVASRGITYRDRHSRLEIKATFRELAHIERNQVPKCAMQESIGNRFISECLDSTLRELIPMRAYNPF